MRVNAWLPDDPYPVADIDIWPDEGEPPADIGELIERLHGRVREINDVVREMGDMTPPADAEISSEPAMAIYHLGSLAPLGPSDRHRLLAARGLTERIDVLSAALDDAMAVLEFRRS